MKDSLNKKRYLLGLGAGIASLGLLYGWYVYADQISNDVNAIAQEISSANNGSLPLDSSAVALEVSTATNNEIQQNNAIMAGMYSLGPLATPSAGLDPTAARAANIMTNHFANYCMNGVEGSNCPSDVLLQNADAKVSTILSGTALDAARKAAADSFLFTFIPIPAKNLAPFAVNGTTSIASFQAKNNPNSSAYPDPQQSFADNLSNQALLSIARQPFTEMIAKRTPPQSGGDSMMQMIERVANQRFLSTNWAASLNPPPQPNAPPPTPTAIALQTNVMLQEIALMQAANLWLEKERYRQTERVEALLAALIVQNYNSGQAVSAQISNQPAAAPTSTAPTPAPSP